MSPELAEPYSRQAFLDLVAGLLPEVSRDTRAVSEVSPNFTGVTLLGSSPPLDLQILEVEVAGSLDKRVAIASDAFRLMRHTASYRVLAAFHSNETDQWRVSLLTAKPTIEDGRVITRLSNPRRFSYLLGPGSKLTTPRKQLLSKGRARDFADLSQRFAVEVVNNEFYKEIARLYDDLVGTDDTQGVLKYPGTSDSAHEFAVRLIGRIIFCWFLREKRSGSGTSLVPTEVLSRDAADQGNYYHTTLAPLFFEVLNKHLRNREDIFRSTQYSLIPYLNGGLFSPDDDDFYKFDKVAQVSDSTAIHVPDKWIRQLFDLLELYNFTVDENTSFDVDLSIDPEMLGRIFENLLARINPETGETVRKGTGSFYTPREIVEYMVDESLKCYLSQATSLREGQIAALVRYDLGETDEDALGTAERTQVLSALGSARILDPACGSGAFPIGVLQKIVFILQRADPDSKMWLQKQLVGASPELRRHLEEEFENKNFDYLRKLGVIRESIYGVDIQPIATEISRLRCFLTLVVDQSVEDDVPNRGIEPLPNLDFKFVTANSLIGLKGGTSAAPDQAGLFEDTAGIAQLKELRNEYFSSHNSERDALKLRFARAQNEMLQRMIAQHSHGYAELTKKISTWNPFSHQSTNWFDPEWMFGTSEGFDIVIGNPPYYKENDDKRRFDDLRDLECYQGKMDVWYLFGALGIDLLTTDGTLCYIATNNWVTNAGASRFRNKAITETKILQLVDFGSFFVFESSSIQTMVMLFRKRHDDRYRFDYRRLVSARPTHQDMLDMLAKQASDRIQYVEPTIIVVDRVDSLLTFSDSAEEGLLEKIAARGSTRLSDKEVAQGIVPNPDVLSKSGLSKIPEEKAAALALNVGDGVFVMPKGELVVSRAEARYLKPLFPAEEIHRYMDLPPAKSEIIYIRGSIEENEDSTLLAHLERYREVMEDRRENRTGRIKYYNLHWPRAESFFESGPKVLSIRKCAVPTFTYTTQEAYVMMSVNVIRTKRIDMQYLTGLLNSRLIRFWLKHKGKMQGNNFQIDKEPLLAIPIADDNPALQTRIADLVEKIYSRQGSQETYEAEIDSLIYKHYNISNGEIATIEEDIRVPRSGITGEIGGE